MKFPRGSSIGFFGVFGRSSDLRQLDDAFRALDVHPRMIPDPVKITMSKLLKDRAHDGEPREADYRAAAALIGYCAIGAGSFASANGEDRAAAVEARINAAISAGRGLDAELLLLALHSQLIQPSVRDAFELESSGD
jgi:hypothetical protein